MSRKNRSPEEKARRARIRELLQIANIDSMDDIQNLFKETIAEFMENGLEAELDEDLGYSKYDYKNKATDNSRNGHSSKNLRTSFGDVEVSVPRDRKGEFEPQQKAIVRLCPIGFSDIPLRPGIRDGRSDTGLCRRRWYSRTCSRSRRWFCAQALRESAPWTQNPHCTERA